MKFNPSLLAVCIIVLCFSTSIAQNTYVPDDNFEQALINLGYDSGPLNDSVPTDSIKTITQLDISGKSISELTGIENFAAITELNFSNNQIYSINLSFNTNLVELLCYNNNLLELDLQANSIIESINCSNNTITKLDFSSNTALKFINCSSNNLTALNLKNGTNGLMTGDTYQITGIDIRNNPQLYCCEVDNVENTKTYTTWFKEKWTEYTTDCSAYSVEMTYVPDDNFEQALIDLGYDSDNINDSVPTFSIKNVTILYIGNKNISDLSGIENFESLEAIYCNNNKLSFLDLSSNLKLNFVYCSYNQLSELNLSKNSLLTNLNCSGNQIIDLNLSNNPFLIDLNCWKNKLTGLNIRNGNNQNLVLNASSNPDLLCIQVDDVSYAENSNWTKEKYSGYSEDCSNYRPLMTYIPDDNFEQALIDMKLDYGNLNDSVPTVGIKKELYLYLYNKGIQDLTGIQEFEALTSLACSQNEISEIDLSANYQLKELYCDNNKITAIDLSSNTVLNSLNLANNQLSSLNLKNGNNSNMSIDISDNPNLLCVEVDDPEASYEYDYWIRNGFTAYSEDCSTYVMEMTYVPDNNFEKALIEQKLDFNLLNDSVPTIAIKYLKNLRVRNDIKDLTGIQDFSALELLDINYNQLDSIDISLNEKLKELQCSDNNLTKIKFGYQPQLVQISCSRNKLESLDVENLSKLEILNCSFNNLVDLDLEANTNLNILVTEYNQLSGLTIRNGNNENLYLKTSYNDNLLCIEVDDAQLASTYKNWEKDGFCMYSENCSNYKPNYTYLPDDNFEDWLITLRYDSGTPNDSVITGVINKIETLYINGRQINDFTGLQDFDSLKMLNVSENPIGYLDFSSNLALTDLYCDYCNLDSFTIHKNTKIESLSCNGNNLKNLSLKSFPNLRFLFCSNNFLTEIDLSANTKLEAIRCEYNLLERINMQNENNSNLLYFHSRGNPSACILVDDIEASESNPNWEKDAYSSYSYDCSNNNVAMTYIPDDNFEQYFIDAHQDLVLDDSVATEVLKNVQELFIQFYDISDLTGIQDFTELTALYCDNNKLTNLDLSFNTKLQILGCSNNKLTSLDLETNSLLRNLYCSDNQLENLNVSNCHMIDFINCNNNNITSLNLSNAQYLNDFNAKNNELTELDLRNGNNDRLRLDIINNPNLFCVEVDDPNAAANYMYWYKDTQANYSHNCDSKGVGIPLVEYNSLVNFYNLTNGEEWTTNTNWLDTLNASVDNWAGVTVENGHVVAIDLSNLNIEGEVFDIFSAFDSLTWLNLSNNNLSGRFPTFDGSKSGNVSSVKENAYNLSYLNISNNNFIFSDLEPVADELLAIDTFIYSPQQLIGSTVDTSIYKYENLSIEIEGFTGGEYDNYTWIKDDEIHPNPNRIYSVENASLQDSGIYMLRVENSIFSELTLVSEPYKLSVLIPVGVNNIELKEITLYPNPANERIFIDTQNLKMHLKILDLAGKLILEKSDLTTGWITIDQFPKGIYLFRFETENSGIINKKVVFK